MTHDGIGTSRIDSIERRLQELNPYMEIVGVDENVNESNVAQLVEQVDVVVDCAPLFEERFLLFQQNSYNQNHDVHDQEVLIRLTDFDGIIRSAGYFMPAIEQLNRIEEIDKLVIQKVLQFLQHASNHPVAVNLSKSVLENPLFKKWLINTLTTSKSQISSLSFELTERLILEEKGTAWPLIEGLKQLDVGFGIDHFGASAPYKDLAKEFGFTAAQVEKKIRDHLAALL